MIEDKHMAASLIEKRLEIVREIKELQQLLDQKRADLIHIDNTIELLDPDAVIPEDAPGRPHRKDNYFERGEIARRCMTALREANGEPITIESISLKALSDKKLDPTNHRMRKEFYHKFFMSMRDLCRRRGIAVQVGSGRGNIRWKLAD